MGLFTQKDILIADYYKAQMELVRQDIGTGQNDRNAIGALATGILKLTIKEAEQIVRAKRGEIRSNILNRISELKSKAKSLGFDIFTESVVTAEWKRAEDSRFFGDDELHQLLEMRHYFIEQVNELDVDGELSSKVYLVHIRQTERQMKALGYGDDQTDVAEFAKKVFEDRDMNLGVIE